MRKYVRKMKYAFGLFMATAMLVSQSPLQVLAQTVQEKSQTSAISGNDVSTGNGVAVVQSTNIESVKEGNGTQNLLGIESLAETLSGQCGENLTWTIEGSTLTISGTGAMWDYTRVAYDGTKDEVQTEAPWYEYRTELTELIIEKGVTHIGDYAFANSSNLTGNLTIPEGVTSIGEGAFYCCSGFMGDLMLPEGMTEIGKLAFHRCEGFEGRLILPNSLTTIGMYAFEACSFTGDLLIPEKITSIEDYSFYSCNDFDGKLVIPEGLTSIGSWAFTNCGFSGTLTIPESVTSIGEYAFSGNNFTGDLVIPDGITSIECGVFSFCSEFDGVLYIPAEVAFIGDGAFQGCSGFSGELVLPAGITSIEGATFYGCSGFSGNLVIPESVENIVYYAFEQCTGIETVTFKGDALSDVSFLNYLTAGIGVYYPSYKTGWDIVVQEYSDINWIPYDMEAETLSGQCGENLTWTIEGSTLTISGTGAMWDFDTYFDSNLENYISKAPWIEYSDDLTTLNLENGITHIGIHAFSGCGKLSGNLVLPETVTSIGEDAFLNCSGFSGDLIIPQGVTSIGNFAFGQDVFRSGDAFNGNLILPEGLTEIGRGAFSGCYDLIGDLRIPDSVTSIGAYAFRECRGFDGSLTLSDNLTSIGEVAFGMCSGFKGRVVIPESVTNIELAVFEECTGLTELYFEGDAPTNVTFLDNDMFPTEISIYYPVYRSGWDAVVEQYSSVNWIPYDVEEETLSGRCGENLSWLIEGNTLTISGTGSMDDYGASASTYSLRSTTEPAPWASFMGDLTELNLDTGITHIGSYAFYGATNLDGSLIIPESVETIGNNAFSGCISIDDVHFEGDALSDITFLEDLAEGVEVYYPADREGWGEVVQENEHLNWIVKASGSIAGVIQSYSGETGQIVIRLLRDTEEVTKVESSDGTYQFTDVAEGVYTLEISKPHHVTRTYEVTVEGNELIQDLEIFLLGDITGDGSVTINDWNRVYAHINESNPLTEYELQCADVIGADGKVNVRDWNRLYAHINGINALW
uniref:leucine-rich repeat protein n=1 Tax=Acetatifactor sp. TaxID=1872090 RepID=UPI004056DD09